MLVQYCSQKHSTTEAAGKTLTAAISLMRIKVKKRFNTFRVCCFCAERQEKFKETNKNKKQTKTNEWWQQIDVFGVAYLSDFKRPMLKKLFVTASPFQSLYL